MRHTPSRVAICPMVSSHRNTSLFGGTKPVSSPPKGMPARAVPVLSVKARAIAGGRYPDMTHLLGPERLLEC